MSRNLGSSSLSSLLNSKIPKYNFWSEISMVLPIFTWEYYLVELIDSNASLATLAPFLGPVPHESFLFLKSRIFKMQSFLRCTIFSTLSKWPMRIDDIDILIFPLENANVRQLRLRPQERVFELWYRFEVRNAPSRSELFEFQIFVAARNFYGGNFWQSNITENSWFSQEIMWLWKCCW